MSDNRKTLEEIIHICESTNRDINDELSSDEGRQHLFGSVSWDDVMIHMNSLGYSTEITAHHPAPGLIKEPNEYHPISDVLHKASQATSYLQTWCIDGYKLTVHVWTTWFDGPYEGNFQPFWEWAGDTAEIRKKMWEAETQILQTRPDLETESKKMLDELRY